MTLGNVLLLSISNVCSGYLLKSSLFYVDGSIFSASSLTKTWWKLALFTSFWPVTHLNYVTTTVTVWIGTNEKFLVFLDIGISLES